MVAPGVSPGIMVYENKLAREAGDRKKGPIMILIIISVAPSGLIGSFDWLFPGLTPGATNMPPASRAG